MYISQSPQVQDARLATRVIGAKVVVVGNAAASAVSYQTGLPGILVLGGESQVADVVAADSAAIAITGYAASTAGQFIGVLKLPDEAISEVLHVSLTKDGATAAQFGSGQLSASGNLLLRFDADVSFAVAATSTFGVLVAYKSNE